MLTMKFITACKKMTRLVRRPLIDAADPDMTLAFAGIPAGRRPARPVHEYVYGFAMENQGHRQTKDRGKSPAPDKSSAPDQASDQSEASAASAEAKKKKPKHRRRYLILIAVIVGVIVGLFLGIPYYLHAVSHVSTDDAFIRAHISPVAARVAGHVWKIYVNDNQVVKQGDLLLELDPRDFQTTADRARANWLSVRARLAAAEQNVTLTDITAHAGLSEATASVTMAQANIHTAEAAVRVAQSQLEQARADYTVSQRAYEEAQAQVSAAEPVAVRDHNDLVRYQEMIDTNSVTRQQYDYARAAAAVSAANLAAARKTAAKEQAKASLARAAVQTAQESLAQIRTRLTESRDNLALARARLDSARSAPQKIAISQSQRDTLDAQVAEAEAALKQAMLRLSYTRIYAPVSGRVTHKTVQLGAFVTAGQALMAVVPSEVHVIANFKETDLTHMEPNQPVSIAVDTYPSATFAGHVDSIQAGSGATFSLLPPENATGNYIKVVQRIPVKIVFDRQPDTNDYTIVPGMSVVPQVDISYHQRPLSRRSQEKRPHTAYREPFDANRFMQVPEANAVSP